MITMNKTTFYDKQTISDLSYILSNAFCYRTAYKACKKYNEIRNSLLLEDKQSIFCSLMPLFGNQDYCLYSSNESRQSYLRTLVEVIKSIQNRRFATESIYTHIYEDTVEWAEKKDYEFTIDEAFTDGYIDNLVREKSEKESKLWFRYITEEG